MVAEMAKNGKDIEMQDLWHVKNLTGFILWSYTYMLLF